MPEKESKIANGNNAVDAITQSLHFGHEHQMPENHQSNEINTNGIDMSKEFFGENQNPIPKMSKNQENSIQY